MSDKPPYPDAILLDSALHGHVLECEKRYASLTERLIRLEGETKLLLWLAGGLAASVGILLYDLFHAAIGK